MEVKDIITKGRPSASVAHLPEFRYTWGVHDGYDYAFKELEENRLKHAQALSDAEGKREMEYVGQFINKHHRIPTYSDAIEDTRKAMISKACKWIEYYNNNGGCLFDDWKNDFQKAMEE